jgi:hypothetical protein
MCVPHFQVFRANRMQHEVNCFIILRDCIVIFLVSLLELPYCICNFLKLLKLNFTHKIIRLNWWKWLALLALLSANSIVTSINIKGLVIIEILSEIPCLYIFYLILPHLLAACITCMSYIDVCCFLIVSSNNHDITNSVEQEDFVYNTDVQDSSDLFKTGSFWSLLSLSLGYTVTLILLKSKSISSNISHLIKET